MSDTNQQPQTADPYPELNQLFLTRNQHEHGEIHAIGDSLRQPTIINPTGPGSISSLGISDACAREDHVHGYIEGVWNDLVPYMNPGWGNYGSGFQTAQIRLDGKQCLMRGTVRKSSAAPSLDIVLTLPTQFRPLQNIGYPATCSPGRSFIGITINSSGSVNVEYAGSQTPNAWLLLDGIRWRVD